MGRRVRIEAADDLLQWDGKAILKATLPWLVGIATLPFSFISTLLLIPLLMNGNPIVLAGQALFMGLVGVSVGEALLSPRSRIAKVLPWLMGLGALVLASEFGVPLGMVTGMALMFPLFTLAATVGLSVFCGLVTHEVLSLDDKTETPEPSESVDETPDSDAEEENDVARSFVPTLTLAHARVPESKEGVEPLRAQRIACTPR